MKNKNIILITVLIALFFFLRIYHLEDSLNFGSDQGMTLLETYNLFQAKKITLISQTGSSWTADGRYIFFSSLLYYILMPVLILFSWDPISVSYFLIILQFVSLVFLFWLIARTRNFETAAIFSLLYIISPRLVEHSRFVWTPNFLIPLSSAVLALMFLLSRKKKKLSVIALTIGIICGIGFQMHYSFVLVIIIAISWLLLGKYFRGREYLCLFSGFILMLLPLIVFELRHNFYNLRTAVYIFQAKRSTGQDQIFQFYPHYFLAAAPFLLYAVAKLLNRLKKVNKYFLYILLPFIFYDLMQILPTPSHGYTMVSGWNYQGVKKTRDIILSQDPRNYNIVDIMTQDTRAMNLRYLLTIVGKAPMGIVEYPNASVLYIISKIPIEKILSGSMWELDVVKPARITKTWNVQNDINLYLISRETGKL